MIFAIMNFVLSGAIAVVGILTLRKVSSANEVVFASLPLLFALHQFTQGFVWLGTMHLIEPRALQMAEGIFVFYAQGLLQFLVPLAIWLLEPKGVRKDLIGILMVIGGLLTAYTVWGLSVQPTTVTVEDGVLNYENPWTNHVWVAALYVLTTCGSLILSSSIAIQLFGWLNLIGLTLVYLIIPAGFTSVWCLYAAVISVLLYFYFVERRIAFLQKLKAQEKKYGLSKVLENELSTLEGRYPKFRKNVLQKFHNKKVKTR